jgi:3-oxoadipate enol-lactonase
MQGEKMPTIFVDGTKINYRFDGPEKGPVIMLSNSLASDLGMWNSQISAFVKAGYRVLRYDSRGHGRSDVPQGPYTIEALTADALALLDGLELEKVHFCGLSMGGMVGQMLGSEHGDRLISLSLCSTAAYMPPKQLWNERIEAVRKEGMAAVADATIDRWFTKAGKEGRHHEVEDVRRMVLTMPVEGYCGCCAAIRDMDQRESIKTIALPTLVVSGEHDPATTVADAELIHARIRASILKVVPQAAHFVNVEQALLFNKTVLAFIQANSE